MIFVTGANGLLGSHICKALIDKNYQVKALVRKGSDQSLLNQIEQHIEIVHGDILVPEELNTYLTGVDTIIHCAAIVSFHQADKALMQEVNVTGTTNMVNLALNHNINYFIQISSVAAIGRLLGKGTVDETSKWEESKFNSNYANSKHLAELEVWRSMEEGLEAVVLNPSVIIAPDHFDRSSGQLFKYVWEENLFYPDGLINYVDVNDVTEAILTCLKDKIKTERFILNGGAVTYKSLFEGIATRLNKKPPKYKSHHLLIKIGMYLDWFKSLFTGKRPIITKETVLLSGAEIYFNNEKAKTKLNISFAPLSGTLDWACNKILSTNR